MSNQDIVLGASIIISDGPFATLQAIITEISTPPQKAKGVIELFGRQVPVEVSFAKSPSGLRATATQDRSQIIAEHAGATRYYGITGRITSGRDAGRYIRIDRFTDVDEALDGHAEPSGVMIRVTDDPGMQINCVAEWVEDWAGVEESLRRDGRQIDWG